MSQLFSTIQIGTMTVKNRFVRSAMQDFLGNEDGTISEAELTLYRSLAQGGVGMIVSAHAYVAHPHGRASLHQNGIYEDRFIFGYRRLANIVHEYGSKLIVQVSHAGPQTTLELTEGCQPVTPWLRPGKDNQNAVRQLSIEEIDQLVECYAQAIRRAQDAGCDGAQLHIAHGYLLSRFLSPDTNQRSDDYGGTLVNRQRLIVRIIERARQLVGTDFPLLVKLNSCGGIEGTGSISPEEVVAAAQRLEQLGIAAIEISGGVGSEKVNIFYKTGIVRPEQEAYFADVCAQVKQAVQIPVILVGGIRSRSVMEHILADGIADMISMCRPFVRQPDLVRQFEHGLDKTACVSCNLCRRLDGVCCKFN